MIKSKILRGILIAIEAVLFIAMIILMEMQTAYNMPDGKFHLEKNPTGHSMDPTITEETAFIWVENDIEDVKVGDIILFQKRRATDFDAKEAGMTVTLTDDGIQLHFDNPPNQKDENLAYDPQINVLHRVIDIREPNEKQDLALKTRGDNNDIDDLYPVMKSGYRGKVIFYSTALRDLIILMFEREYYIVYCSITMALLAFLLADYMVRTTKGNRNAANTSVAGNG